MKKPKIIVVGSTNMDMVAGVDRLPKWGETVLSKSFSMNPGGKGANQAVACAQLGAETIFVTALGDDVLGDSLLRNLRNYNLNTQFIKQVTKTNSGMAFICVDNRGNNQIIVVPGANHQLTPQDIREREAVFDNADMVLLQLEIPIETIEETVKLAVSRNIPIILNPAPIGYIGEYIYKNITYITPNEFEASYCGGSTNPSKNAIELGARFFHAMGVPHVIVTRGENGAMYFSKEESYRVKAPKVKAVDSTGAGDAFNGGLAYALAIGKPMKEAIQFANYVGALSTTKPGAQQSMPTLQEVLDFITTQSTDSQ